PSSSSTSTTSETGTERSIPRSIGCARRARRRCSSSRPKAPSGSNGGGGEPSRTFWPRRRARSSAPPPHAPPPAPRRATHGERSARRRRQLAEAGDFDENVENDDRERAADELAAIVARELNGAATMARP